MAMLDLGKGEFSLRIADAAGLLNLLFGMTCEVKSMALQNSWIYNFKEIANGGHKAPKFITCSRPQVGSGHIGEGHRDTNCGVNSFHWHNLWC